MSENNPWTLEKWHVRSHLRSQGLIVPEEAIFMPDETIHHTDGVRNQCPSLEKSNSTGFPVRT